jgi:hypothetical protein
MVCADDLQTVVIIAERAALHFLPDGEIVLALAPQAQG